MIHLLTFNKVFLFKIKTHILITKVKLIWLNLWPNLSTEILFILCIYAKMTTLFLNENGLRVRK
jgi:hypothetical protein